MDDVTYREMQKIIGDLTLQNKQLRRANTRQKKKIRYLRRVIVKLKEENRKNGKQHYRNGRKRGQYGHKG